MNRGPVLLVEDTPDDEFITLTALRSAGVTRPILVARDGVEALDYFFADSAPSSGSREIPRLVLLDINLPKVDGLEVLQQLRQNERTRLIPVVVYSSSNHARDIKRAYESGANGYVTKPIDFEEVCERLQQIVKYWLGLNEHPLLPRRNQ